MNSSSQCDTKVLAGFYLQIQEALEALSAISSSEALADHFEDKYYGTLQECIAREEDSA